MMAQPLSCAILIPVWGKRYVDRCLETTVRSLLASGNLPAAAEDSMWKVVFLTTKASIPQVTSHGLYPELAKHCAVSFIEIDDLVVGGYYGYTLTLAYARGIRAERGRQTGTYFVFLNADFIFSNAALSHLTEVLAAGARAVMCPSIRCNEEPTLAILNQLGGHRKALDVDSRTLAGIALDHLHPTVEASLLSGSRIFSHSACNQFFWRVDNDTMIGAYYLQFMLCIRPERPLEEVVGFCDYTFVPQLVPSGRIHVVANSDDILLLELADERQEIFYVTGRRPYRSLARKLSEWTNANHRLYARTLYVIHRADRPAGLEDHAARFRRCLDDIERLMSRSPQPVRGHYYWRSMMRYIALTRNVAVPADLRVSPSFRRYWIERSLRELLIRQLGRAALRLLGLERWISDEAVFHGIGRDGSVLVSPWHGLCWTLRLAVLVRGGAPILYLEDLYLRRRLRGTRIRRLPRATTRIYFVGDLGLLDRLLREVPQDQVRNVPFEGLVAFGLRRHEEFRLVRWLFAQAPGAEIDYMDMDGVWLPAFDAVASRFAGRSIPGAAIRAPLGIVRGLWLAFRIAVRRMRKKDPVWPILRVRLADLGAAIAALRANGTVPPIEAIEFREVAEN